MIRKYTLTFIFIAFVFAGFAQGPDCNNSDPFCTGTTYTFPNTTGGDDLGTLGCLDTSPNAAWYFLEIEDPGDINIHIEQVDDFGDPIDVDFICWGPFPSIAAGCAGGIPPGSGVDCSYLPDPEEDCFIPGAAAGEIYILLLTNFEDVSGEITFSQTSGLGTTDCSVLCGVTDFTSNPTTCNPLTNTYDVSGSLEISNPPATGTLTFTNSCGGPPIVINAPFPTSIGYSFLGLSPTGSNCTVTSTFSADPACNSSVDYTAPGPCSSSPCNISVTSSPGACNPATNTYNVTGTVTFAFPPVTGTLTVTSSCGGSQTFNAPFSSPLNYSLNFLPANGAACTITAVFSDSSACTASSNYTAPVGCGVCNISSVTSTVSGCNATTNTYTASGNVVFANAPATGTLTVTSSCGGSQTFSAPFVSPLAYSFTGLPAAGGSCTIIATFSDDAGCTNSTTYTVPTPPTITPVSPVCISAPAFTMSASPTGGTWSGAISPLTGTFTPATAGTGPHTITYTTTGCALSATTTVTVNPLPTVTAPADVAICPGSNVSLPVTGTATGFNWSPATGLSSATSSNPTASPAGTTTYTVTGTDANGCVSTDNVTVTVNPTPVIVANGPATICYGDSVQLNASGAITYLWSPAASLSNNTISNPIAYPAANTTYTVVGADANGCTSTATVFITVNDPDAAFTPTPASGTPPLEVYFDNQSTGATYYVWTFDNGFGETTTNASPDASTVYPEVGNYVVTLVAVNGACTDTTQYTIVVYPASSLLVPNIVTANGDGLNDVFKVTSTALVSLDIQVFNRWGQLVGTINAPDGKWDGNDHSAGTYYYVLHAVGNDDVLYEMTGNFSLVK